MKKIQCVLFVVITLSCILCGCPSNGSYDTIINDDKGTIHKETEPKWQDNVEQEEEIECGQKMNSTEIEVEENTTEAREPEETEAKPTTATEETVSITISANETPVIPGRE